MKSINQTILNPTKRAYLELHLAVFLFGFTGILGKLISLPETTLVWWRMFFATLGFLVFYRTIRQNLRHQTFSVFWKLAGIGVLVALHWICFFGSIKYSNVSIALVCFATTTFFTALLEPVLLKKPLQWHELLLSLLIIPGMYFVVQGIQTGMWVGIFLGFLGALLAAIFSILNKKHIGKIDAVTISAIQLGSGWLFLSLLMPFYLYVDTQANFLPTFQDIGYLLILGWVCTTFAYVLSVRVLKIISAFIVNLTISLEPIYSIILAFFIFQEYEQLGNHFYIGALIIIGAVFVHPLISRWQFP